MKNENDFVKEFDANINDYNQPRARGGRKKNLSEAEMPLLFLVPLIETAWAHGAIARSEKHLIFTAAREENVDAKSFLNETLDELLTYQPGREFFDDCLWLIKIELAAMTVKERKAKCRKLIERCRTVAAAAGGNSAMDTEKFISPEESRVLTRLVAELNFRDRNEPRERLPFYATGKISRTFAG